MHEATVCHLLRGDGDQTEVLLGRRSSLFANGLWNGPGGHLEAGETIFQCLKREVKEEVGVQINLSSAKHFATADFYYPTGTGHCLEWRVHFLSVTKWKGEPRTLDGFDKLQWFPRNNLPYSLVMADQPAWLPIALHNATDRLLVVEVYYADMSLKKVARGSFRFVDRYAKSKRGRRK